MIPSRYDSLTTTRFEPTPTYDCCCVGDAFVELASADHPIPEASEFHRTIGGFAATVALYSAQLGSKTSCIAAVGADPFGTFIQHTFRQAKVQVSGLQFNKEFPTSIMFRGRSGSLDQTLFLRQADWQLHNTKEHTFLAQSCRIVFGSGFGLWKHPARHSVFEILRLAKKVDTITILNPHYGPGFYKDREDGYQTIKKTLQFADIATPRLMDAEDLFGKMSKEDYIKKYLDLGVKKVILWAGREGALVSDGAKIVRVPASIIDVVDRAGTHEAWHAGLMYAMTKGKELANAAYFGNIVAAYVAQRQGALVPIPDAETLAQEMTARSFRDL